MTNEKTSFLGSLSALRDALVPRGRHLVARNRETVCKSIMTGSLPMTKDWLDVYPLELHSGLDFEELSKLVWPRFRRRHEVANERAHALRKAIGNEILRVTQPQGDKLVSSLQPEIEFAGCVGASLNGSGIMYMDIVAIYKRTGDIVTEAIGEPVSVTDDGWKVYDTFSIDIGDGVYLKPGSIAELRFDDDKIAEATASCPENVDVWPTYGVHKLRHVDLLKVSPEGELVIGVSKNRKEREAGDDHTIENIRGRIITRYDRNKYEAQLRAAGSWRDMSFGARHPDFLKPDFSWDTSYPDIDPDLKKDADDLIMGRATFGVARVNEIRAALNVSKLAMTG